MQVVHAGRRHVCLVESSLQLLELVVDRRQLGGVSGRLLPERGGGECGTVGLGGQVTRPACDLVQRPQPAQLVDGGVAGGADPGGVRVRASAVVTSSRLASAIGSTTGQCERAASARSTVRSSAASACSRPTRAVHAREVGPQRLGSGGTVELSGELIDLLGPIGELAD